MVAVQILTTWVQASTPVGMELATTLLLLYFCHPLLQSFPGLSDVYNYAVYTSSIGLAVTGVSLWIEGGLCARLSPRVYPARPCADPESHRCVLLWGLALDPVSSELGRLASTHFLSQAVLASVQVSQSLLSGLAGA